MSEEKPRGFVVTDRRSFTTSGEPRPEDQTPPQAPPAPAAPGAPAAGPAAAAASSATARSREGRLPPVDFPTFVLSLGSSALMHMGEELPGAGPADEKNLPLAKHTIDLLSMLQEKTRGNLSAPEAELLENLLYDLRLRFVERSRP